MKAPDPIVIELTPKQVDSLERHYAYVAYQHDTGKTGMLVAQVGDIRFGGERFIKVGFIPQEKAKFLEVSPK